MTVGEFQFSATLLMGLLTLSLAVVLPRKVDMGTDVSRSRWMLATGTLLLTIHFYLQYRLGFRAAGNVEESVFLNLLFFMPASWLINLSMIYLLRKGDLQLWEWLTGPAVYGVSLTILIVGKLTDGEWLNMKHAEYVVSTIYGITLLLYNVQEFIEFRRVRRALDIFYNHSMNDKIRWFGISLTLMAMVALSSPISIFYNNRIILSVCGITIIVCIYYYVLSFICFSVSESTYLLSIVKEEEENEEIVLPESLSKNPDSNNNQRVEQAIKKWLEERGHLKTGITIQDAVEEMQIPRYLLVQWIKNTEFEVFSRWITHLRVEEAKRLLTAHSEYSNEAIAHECGFSSRSYFQKIFREQTGMTPVEYQTKKTSAS